MFKKAFAAAILLGFSLLPLEGRAENYPVYKIGAIAQEATHNFRDHTDALFYWMSAYADGLIPAKVTLIHIDQHPDDFCACFKKSAFARHMLEVFKNAPRQERRRIFDSLCSDSAKSERMGIDTFIIPAMQMGLIEKVIWIKPNFRYFDNQGNWRREKFFIFSLDSGQLNAVSYCGEKYGALPYSEDCSLLEFEVTGFPEVNTPVLLDIDMDFFGDRDMSHRCGLYFSPEQAEIITDELIEFLREKLPGVYLLTLADSPKEHATKTALSRKSSLIEKLTK